MGDVLDPQPPQWKSQHGDVEGDEILHLSTLIFKVLHGENSNTVNSLASLRLVQKSVTAQVAHFHGMDTAKEAMRQAGEIADDYTFTIKEEEE